MSKSIKSKIKRKYRRARREFLEATEEKVKLESKVKKLNEIISGKKVAPEVQKPNAFLYPENPEAVIPQVRKRKLVDLRLAVANINF